MDKKFLLALPILVFVIGLYFFLTKENIEQFNQNVTKQNSKDLQNFLYENNDKFVKLAITLSPEISNNITRGSVEDNKIEFTAPDTNNPKQKVKYRIKLLDSGIINFDFDENSGRISGNFITYRGVASDGSPIVNLIPL